MKIQSLEVFQAGIPFRFRFKHAAAERATSDSIFVKLTLENGVHGWGEGLPRPYVTGETVESSLHAVQRWLAPLVVDERCAQTSDVYALASKIAGEILPGEADGGLTFGAARCAVETALLDASAKQLKMGFSEWLGPPARQSVYATAVLPGMPRAALPWVLGLVRANGFKAVKLKVGTPRDEENLRLLRRVLGPGPALILDANGAWQADEAVENLSRWKSLGIAAVEQPVAPRDFIGMRLVRETTGIPVMADESLRTLQDAENLIDARAADIFNIRLSKCGGAIASWKILKLAQAAGLRAQLGCQVGESSVLAAAGKWFALCAPQLAYFEGGYGRLLLKQDVAAPVVSCLWRGKINARRRDLGLGINVDENMLRAYARTSQVLAF